MATNVTPETEHTRGTQPGRPTTRPRHGTGGNRNGNEPALTTSGSIPQSAAPPALSRHDLLLLAAGAALLALVGWRLNLAAAAWLAPVFLIRFFRTQQRWQATLLATPVMAVALGASLIGSWDDLPLAAWFGIGLARAAPFLVALYADRLLARRLPALPATLVYPAVYVLGDFVTSLTPLGTVFSVAATQFSLQPLVQLAALTGVWGISFLTGWFATTVNLAWEQRFDLRATAARSQHPSPAATAVAVFVVAATAVAIYGGLRMNLARPDNATVRVGSVTVAHPRDYWLELDAATPADGPQRLGTEIAQIREQLFARSARLAQAGARIIFWSEGNAVMYDHEVEPFLDRAGAFAREHDVYLAPAVLILTPGETIGANRVLMVDPSGELLFSYEKTKSWLPTNSDGVLPVIETPYGTVAAAICFDMDFPSFVHQLADREVDIMLAPSYDWQPIAPFHTEVGMFRAVEMGFAMVRQVNEGTSMAVDAVGNQLAYQSFFATEEPVMLTDVPMRGTRTLYARLGDWFVALSGLGLLVLVVAALRRHHRPAPESQPAD